MRTRCPVNMHTSRDQTQAIKALQVIQSMHSDSLHRVSNSCGVPRDAPCTGCHFPHLHATPHRASRAAGLSARPISRTVLRMPGRRVGRALVTMVTLPWQHTTPRSSRQSARSGCRHRKSKTRREGARSTGRGPMSSTWVPLWSVHVPCSRITSMRPAAATGAHCAASRTRPCAAKVIVCPAPSASHAREPAGPPAVCPDGPASTKPCSARGCMRLAQP